MSALRISIPGQPIRIVAEFDEATLTPRQRKTLDTLRAYRGDRRRAARALGITKEGIEGTIRRIRRAGAAVPPGLGTRLGIPNDRPRERAPICGRLMVRSGATCGLPVRHANYCRSEAAVAKDRAWRSGRMLRARGRAA